MSINPISPHLICISIPPLVSAARRDVASAVHGIEGRVHALVMLLSSLLDLVCSASQQAVLVDFYCC